MKRFHWSRPGQYPVDAQVVGEAISRLKSRDPPAIVEAARSRKSPLHPLFDWNQSSAAERFRLVQAQMLLGALQVDVVVYRRKEQETLRVRAVVRTSRAGSYDSIEDAMATPASRDFVLAQAIAQLKALKRRYATLSELAVVFAAVDEVAAASAPRKKRRRN